MMGNRYILVDGEPVEEPDLIKWAEWFGQTDVRVLAKSKAPDGSEVSTIFLGLDHSFGCGPPVLWETMIFGGEHDQYQDRYSSREDAMKGHEKALALARD